MGIAGTDALSASIRSTTFAVGSGLALVATLWFLLHEYRDRSPPLLAAWRAFLHDASLLEHHEIAVQRALREVGPDRIVNVHGSDLTAFHSSGLPRYMGLRAVADAMAREGISRGIVVGHSMGGLVICKASELVPARIADALLADG